METVFTRILVAASAVFLASGLQNVRADGFWDDDEEEVVVVVPDVGSASDDSIDAVRRRVAEKKKALWKEFEERQKAILNEAEKAIKAEKPVKWTHSDTEWFWNRIVDSSSKTSTKPRFPQADEEGGEGLLETFGTQYLPNAYAYYQEARATAKEREQVLAENFPDGRASDATGGALYDKVRKATAKAVAEMFRRHDELCHYLLLHRMGAVSDQKLVDRDSSRISIVLPEEADPPEVYDRSAPVLAPSEIDFATKYLPETRAAFQRLDNAFSEGVKTYGEWRETALLVDATRSDALFQPLRDRLDAIHGQMEGIVRMVKEQKLLHAVGETSAAALADADSGRGLSIQQFEKGLSVGAVVGNHVRMAVTQLKAPRLAEYERDRDNRIAVIRKKARRDVEDFRRTTDAVVAQFDQELAIFEIIASMVAIPGRSYKMGKYEVTQAQWEAIMGENPSCFKGANNPVEQVSWDDCQKFLRKINAHPVVKKSGLIFRLPTAEEWEVACRAGSTGEYCRLADETEITKDSLGRVAWFNGSKTHPVGQKQPNAFGLYDMHGNVEEWTSTAYGRDRVRCGGGWGSPAWYCESSQRSHWLPSHGFLALGFRLCASGKAD